MKELYVNDIINDIKAGTYLSSVFAVRKKVLRKTKSNEDYCTISLQDKSGCIDGIIWPKFSEYFNTFEEGDIVEVSGSVTDFKGSKQIEINNIKKIEKNNNFLFSDFIRITKNDIETMASELMIFINSIKNKYLKKLLILFFGDKEFSNSFYNSSAAVQYHHAFIGGLLEHTLSVLNICNFLSDYYKELNRDLLLAGAILHDIGKVMEYKLDDKSNTIIQKSDEGKLLGHIVIGYGMVCEKIKKIKGFPEDLRKRLLHIIISHHGEKEFGSPKRPKILEAFVIYHIDHMDADIGGFRIVAEKSGGKMDWSDYLKNFERSIYLKNLDSARESDELYEELEVDISERLKGNNDSKEFKRIISEVKQDELF